MSEVGQTRGLTEEGVVLAPRDFEPSLVRTRPFERGGAAWNFAAGIARGRTMDPRRETLNKG